MCALAQAIQLELEGGPKPPQGGWSQTVTDDKDAVKITLSDCLACSGCVTSAETVRVQGEWPAWPTCLLRPRRPTISLTTTCVRGEICARC